MFDVRLTGGRLCGRQLFAWLSLVDLLWCPFFPLDVLGEIWDLVESVSEGFLTYSYRNGKKYPTWHYQDAICFITDHFLNGSIYNSNRRYKQSELFYTIHDGFENLD